MDPDSRHRLKPGWRGFGFRLLNGVARLWRPRVLLLTCVSSKAGAVVLRSDEVLSGASAAQARLKISWPFWWPRKRRRIRVRMEVQSRSPELTGQNRAVSPAPLCEVEQRDTRRLSRVNVHFPPWAWAKGGELQLQVAEACQNTCVGCLTVNVLDEQATRELLLAHIRAQDFRLWIRDGAQFYPGSVVPACATCVIPEFRITGSPFSAFVSPESDTLTLNWISDGQVRTLESRPIKPAVSATVIRGSPIPMLNPALVPRPGAYQLQVKLGEHEVGLASVRVLNEPELLRHVRVAAIQIDAERRDGKTEFGLKTLRWEEHQGFRAELRIETDIPAPNTVAKCIVRTLQGTQVLRREEFLLPLNRTVRHVRLQRMEFGIPGLQARPKPARLVVSVCIGGEVKGSAPVLVLPPDKITNYEGQLRFDAQELAVDEVEYEQVVQRLGLGRELAARQGFWARIYNWLSRCEPEPLLTPGAEGAPGVPDSSGQQQAPL